MDETATIVICLLLACCLSSTSARAVTNQSAEETSSVVVVSRILFIDKPPKDNATSNGEHQADDSSNFPDVKSNNKDALSQQAPVLYKDVSTNDIEVADEKRAGTDTDLNSSFSTDHIDNSEETNLNGTFGGLNDLTSQQEDPFASDSEDTNDETVVEVQSEEFSTNTESSNDTLKDIIDPGESNLSWNESFSGNFTEDFELSQNQNISSSETLNETLHSDTDLLEKENVEAGELHINILEEKKRAKFAVGVVVVSLFALSFLGIWVAHCRRPRREN